MRRSAIMLGMVSLGLFLLVFGGLIPGSPVPARAASDVIKWRCQAHTPPVQGGHYKYGLLAVADEIKSRTNGRFIIEPYGEGSFVPAKEIFNAVRRGMLEAGFASSAYIQSQVPLAAVSNGLPFGLRDTWEAAYFIQMTGIEQMMKDALLKYGCYYYSDSVNAWELALKKPVKTMEDFKGLKIRSAGMMEKYFASIGAAPTFLPASELYTGLATGVVDGAHFGDVIGAEPLKLFEVCKYHLTTPLLYGASTIWLINKKAFDSLPKDLQDILHSTLTEHFWTHTFQNRFMVEEAYQRIQKQDKVQLIELPPAEFEKMQKAALKIWDEVAAKSPECAKGVKMLIDFNKALGRLKDVQ
jgi:TRAP-type C4-dicarboxylate transport system substrate-binding protein